MQAKAQAQPHSQGSLLPTLWSSVGRVGENPGNEVSASISESQVSTKKSMFTQRQTIQKLRKN